jgi:hypothetical protein
MYGPNAYCSVVTRGSCQIANSYEREQKVTTV